MQVSDTYTLKEDMTKKAAIHQYTLHFNIKVFASDDKVAQEQVVIQIRDKLGLDEDTIRNAMTPVGGNLNSSNIWMGKYFKDI